MAGAAPTPRHRQVPQFISVIIPHYNDLANLSRCLERLERQTFPRDRFEVIVADNNSACGIDAVRTVATRATVVPAPIQGAGPARNAAVAVSRGDALAFIDSDCFADPGWLDAGAEALVLFDFAGGEVRTTVADEQRLSAAEAYEAVFAFNFRKYIEKDKFSGTGNLFVSRRVFDQVGPFRGGVSEDVEWSHRATGLGFTIGFVPAAIVDHPARATWADLTKKWARVVREGYLLTLEKRFGRTRWLARAIAVTGSPFLQIPQVLASPRLPGLRNKAMGVLGLMGVRFYRAAKMVQSLVMPL
jgi:glycosyltransferase involved in cell wall biosynthesis